MIDLMIECGSRLDYLQLYGKIQLSKECRETRQSANKETRIISRFVGGLCANPMHSPSVAVH